MHERTFCSIDIFFSLFKLSFVILVGYRQGIGRHVMFDNGKDFAKFEKVCLVHFEPLLLITP